VRSMLETSILAVAWWTVTEDVPWCGGDAARLMSVRESGREGKRQQRQQASQREAQTREGSSGRLYIYIRTKDGVAVFPLRQCPGRTRRQTRLTQASSTSINGDVDNYSRKGDRRHFLGPPTLHLHPPVRPPVLWAALRVLHPEPFRPCRIGGPRPGGMAPCVRSRVCVGGEPGGTGAEWAEESEIRCLPACDLATMYRLATHGVSFVCWVASHPAGRLRM